MIKATVFNLNCCFLILKNVKIYIILYYKNVKIYIILYYKNVYSMLEYVYKNVLEYCCNTEQE